MKIAITGAAGFLGKYLVSELKKDHQLFLYSRSKENLKNNFDKHSNLILIETDYSFLSLEKNFIKYDAFIHLAAKRYLNNEPLLSQYTDNISITENIFYLCSRFKISNIVLASSRSVYSPGLNPIPFNENDKNYPLNSYAMSKLISERFSNNFPINIKVLRLAQLIGLGEREGYMFSAFINKAIKKEVITLFGEGEGRREYLYVKDAVSAIVSSLKNPEKKGVFNIGSGFSISHKELAENINEVFAEGKSEIIFDKSKTEDKQDYCMDISKAKKELGWKANYGLKGALLDMKKEQTKII